MDDLALTYTNATETELKTKANQIINSTGDLGRNFKWGKEIADLKIGEREKLVSKRQMDRKITDLQRTKTLKKKLGYIAKTNEINQQTTLPPGERARWLEATTPVIQEFAGRIKPEKFLLDSLPPELIGTKEKPTDFGLALAKAIHEYGGEHAVSTLPISAYTPTVQSKLYKGIRNYIVQELGPMTKAELTPLVGLVMGEFPDMQTNFGKNKLVIQLKADLAKVDYQAQIDLKEMDKQKIQDYKYNLGESIVRDMIKRSTHPEHIHDVEAPYSVDMTIKRIKNALGVKTSGKGKWSKDNIHALNIAIGGLMQGLRVDWEGLDAMNDYVIPKISKGTDINELPVNALIDGLKDHIEFAASKVENADLFEKTVGTYLKQDPASEQQQWWKEVIRRSPLGATGVFTKKKPLMPHVY
jgi:hypothetical protein